MAAQAARSILLPAQPRASVAVPAIAAHTIATATSTHTATSNPLRIGATPMSPLYSPR